MNKRFLVAAAFAAVMSTSVAHAADLPRKMPVKAMPVAAPLSWTGFYVGAHAGGGWGNNNWSDFIDPVFGTSTPGPDANYRVSGALAGGQIGYNWQTGWTVFGIEADASWANIKGSGNNSPQLAGNGCLNFSDYNGCTSKIEALGTITGRVGAAFDHALFYVKGGGAWAVTKHTASAYFATLDPGFNLIKNDVSGNTNQTRWGWTIGAGVEYAFAANWSLKAEYNYINLGSERVNFTYVPNPDLTSAASGNAEQILHVAKAGINYRF